MNGRIQNEPEGPVGELLAEYLQRVDSGENVDRDRFVKANPSCADELRAFFAGEDQIEGVALLLQPALEKHQDFSKPSETDKATQTDTDEGENPPYVTSINDVTVLGSTSGSGQDQNPDAISAHSQRLGDYEILEEIAHGGMGIVYKARQNSLNRIVALKVIRSEKLSGEEAIKRFKLEAESAASLRHPHIVAIHEIGEQEGRHFYSMQYVEGMSLAALLQEGPLSAAEAARYLETITEAIDYAHHQQILHRDLKPANVLIDSRQRPHITDFGIAKRVEDDSDLTATGQILGTPSYMSPEQTLGLSVGPTSDIYSLGALLYALLTARPPFHAETPVDTLIQVRSADPVSPRLLNSTVPRDLDTICLKCLEKNPTRRYQSAGELAAELRRFLDGKPIQARSVGRIEKTRRWCNRNRTVAALILLTLGTLVTGTLVSSAMYFKEAAALAGTREILSRMYVKEADLHDTDSLMHALPWLAASLRLDEGNPDREPMSRVRLAATLQACPSLEQMWFHDGPVEFATASHDGRLVLSVSRDKTARVWETNTGKPLTEPLLHQGGIFHGAFSHDGKYIAVACNDAMAHVWEVATGKLLVTLRHGMRPERPELPAFVHRVRFRPPDSDDPDQLIIATACFDHTARVWDCRTGEELAKLQHAGPVRDVQFSPNGRLLVTASGDRTARIWDWSASGESESGKVRLLSHDAQVVTLTVSPDGTRVITGTSKGEAWIWETESGIKLTPQPLQHSGKWITDIACSPGGEYLATACDDGTARLWWLASGQPALKDPFRHSVRVESVAFSADGQLLATGSLDRTARVWDVATGDPVTPPIVHSGKLFQIEFVPEADSRPWLLTTCGDGTVRLWKFQAEPERYQLPHEKVVSDMTRAGTSDRFILTSKDRHNALVVCDVDGDGELTTHTISVHHEQHGHQLALLCSAASRDGRTVATGGADGIAIVWDVETEQPLTPPLHHNAPLQHLEFSSDGHLLLSIDGKGKGPKSNVTCWDVGLAPGALWSYSGEIWHATFHPGKPLAAIADGRSILLYDADSGETIHTGIQHDGTIHHCRFSPDGKMLLTCSNDETARLWEIPSGAPHGSPLQHWQDVHYAQFDRSGKLIVTATAGYEGTARIWDAASAEPLSRSLPHGGASHFVAFGRDGRFLLTMGSKSEAAYLWSVATSEPAIPPMSSADHVKAAFFTQHEDRVLLLCQQENKGRLRQWLQLYQMPSESRPLAELQAEVELLSSRRIDELSDSVPCSTEELRRLWAKSNGQRK